MTTFLIIIIIVAAIAGFIIYRIISVKKAGRRISQKRIERVRALYEKLESGQPVTEADVYEFAKNMLAREMTFHLLRDRDLTGLFPGEYFTFEKAVESNLANWLEFPTELNACPDEIEHLKRVTIDYDGQNNFVHYEVFKYRVNKPHWAAKQGWMLGVVGPYFDDSKPYDFPHATFSRTVSTVDKTTPEEEANWVHENISRRR